MRLLVCGGRNWTDKQFIKLHIMTLHDKYSIEVIIEGEAKGADTLSREIAIEMGIPVLAFPANWKEYGKSAGPIRNHIMLREGKPDYILAFHDNVSQSKGTKHMITIAEKAGIPTNCWSH